MQDVERMTREELIREVLQSRQELSRLRNIVMEQQEAQGGRARSGGFGEVLDTGKKYQLSYNVLLVGGQPGQRVIRTISLQDVLNKSFGRLDQRDGDTPVYFQGALDGRLSSDQGRFSEASFGGFNSPDRVRSSHEAGEWSRASTEVCMVLGSDGAPVAGQGQAQGQGQVAQEPKGKPAPMLHLPKGQLRLDSDAIVSHHTLLNFNTAYGHRPLSPESTVGASMIRYLGDFTKRGYVHHEDWREAFGRSFLKLCNEVESLMKDEARHPTIKSPCYVFGDLHGNMRDLMYFGENIINFQDFRFTPYNLLFLGDYVDRGEHSIEVVAYLFALKVLAPKQVTLLRGNHEDTLVNGDTRTYGETSLKGECIALFSNVLGTEVWQRANEIFTWLPLSANIDGRIFCTHGGLPRYSGGRDDRLELLKSPFFPRMQSFFAIPADEDEVHAKFRQLASDVCWSDPAEDDRMTNEFGFGNNPRGQGVILFGNKAVDTFLDNFGFEYIFRAHQEKSDGVKLSKNARVMTIFSTSAYVGHSNGAGVVFVNNGKIRLIIKQPDE